MNTRLMLALLASVLILSMIFLAFFNNVGDIRTKYDKLFDRGPCQLEGVTSFYLFDRRGDELYFLPKPVNGSLADLQETGYAWDGASEVIVSNRSQPACQVSKPNDGNSSFFYCNDWGYYAKIPPSDKEFVKGQREAHSYLIDLVLFPEFNGSATRYKVVSAFCSNKEPEM